MYIWRVNRLIEDFKNGDVTERQQLNYLLVIVAFSYVIGDPFVHSLLAYDSINTLDTLVLPTSLVIGIAGTVVCYHAAPKSSTGFIPRYLCLGLPVLVRIGVVAVLVVLFAFAINDSVDSLPGVDQFLESDQTTVIEFVGICVFEVLYFGYLRHAIEASYA